MDFYWSQSGRDTVDLSLRLGSGASRPNPTYSSSLANPTYSSQIRYPTQGQPMYSENHVGALNYTPNFAEMPNKFTSGRIFVGNGHNIGIHGVNHSQMFTRRKRDITAYATSEEHKRCMHCGTQKTPMWRKGPSGRNTLCNACGIKWSRLQQKMTDQNQPLIDGFRI